MIEKDGVVFDELKDSIKDKRCYMKHIDKLVMVIRILCILSMQGAGFLLLEQDVGH
jgi:hypothetical protein